MSSSQRLDDRTPPSKNLAFGSLVLGILSGGLSIIAGIPAIVCGVISLRRSSVGKWMAIAGIILGTIGSLLIPLIITQVLPTIKAVARTRDVGLMMSSVLSVHEYASVSPDKVSLPPADGNVSWRVLILPQVGQNALYHQFDFTQPWDSAKNRPLGSKYVGAFVSPNDPPGSSETRIRVFTGPDTLFPPGKPPIKLNQIGDGLGQTIFAVQTEERVPWSQPKELPYTKDGPLPQFSKLHSGVFLIGMVDGSVCFQRDSIAPKNIRAAITPNGGETFDSDW